MPPFKVVIPARLSSSRLPAKVLRDLGGKPMIWHSYNSAERSGAEEIVVATDSKIIADCVNDFGGRFVMTGVNLKCGTERVATVANLLSWSDENYVVNLQGDEPLMLPEHIAALANFIAEKNSAAATLATKMEGESGVDNNVVKVVCDQFDNALYFSRTNIPYTKERLFTGLRHLGIYAYTCAFLRRYISWPVSYLEERENLEQLRILENREGIRVLIVENTPARGVDTFEDMEKTRDFITARH